MALTLKSSDVIAVSGASAQFSAYSSGGTVTMQAGVEYELTATTDIWYRHDSANPTAAANTDSNHFLARGRAARVAGAGFKVAVIQDSAGGFAELAVIGDA